MVRERRDHPVNHAAAAIDATVARMRGMKMMPHASARTEARRERIDNAAPDIQQYRDHLPMHMLDTLAKLDREK